MAFHVLRGAEDHDCKNAEVDATCDKIDCARAFSCVPPRVSLMRARGVQRRADGDHGLSWNDVPPFRDRQPCDAWRLPDGASPPVHDDELISRDTRGFCVLSYSSPS